MKIYQAILCGVALMISSCGQNENKNTVINNETTNEVSRTGCDVVVSNSTDGEKFNILRFTHINKAEDAVCIGVYACSPGEGASFKAVFLELSFSK